MAHLVPFGQFFHALVDLDAVGDTYLDLSKWTKGVVWVNGRNLGRSWQIGPQQLHCSPPASEQGVNEMLIFDLPQVTRNSSPCRPHSPALR
ncbi:hypothetical protein ACH4UM_39845 [Streptomyces sp. NPDC020801]|uniref:hypothetical protein n=1 Tax=unclassified Streptomyces TaxID=2593676 RepID=UPI00378AC9A9